MARYVVSVVEGLQVTRVRIGCEAPARAIFDYLTERSQKYASVNFYQSFAKDDRSPQEKERAAALIEEALGTPLRRM